MQRAPTTTVTKIKAMHSLAPHCYEDAESEKCTNTHVSEQPKQYPTPKVSHAKKKWGERGRKIVEICKNTNALAHGFLIFVLEQWGRRQNATSLDTFLMAPQQQQQTKD